MRRGMPAAEKASVNYEKNKHNAELQRTDPGTKVTGKFSTMGHILPRNV